MTNATILHMRVEWFAEHYRGEPFHAILTDPPYHLTPDPRGITRYNGAMQEKWRSSREAGFMGKRWDGGDIAFRPETWAGLAEHLHPGGFGMAFASSRGWHRLAVAIEDAGLIIHPTIFGYSFGSGFPKATRIDTQVDRDAGAEREVVGKYPEHRKKSMTSNYWQANNGYRPEGEYPTDADGSITAPATDLAQTWQGHRYGLQALKPALEPIIVFQKPYQGRPVDNITATGAGALWIDGGRIPANEALVRPFIKRNDNEVYGQGLGAGTQDEPSGRWPANLLLLDDDAAAALDAQSGTVGGGGSGSTNGALGQSAGWNKHNNKPQNHPGFGDTGGASRFFYRVRAALDDADPVCYTAKASRAEREAGLEGFGLADGSVGDRRPSGSMSQRIHKDEGRPDTIRRNGHPTVKPLDLARYLSSLLLPPDEYAPRRLLVPFCGSGSEVVGGFMAGWDEIVGVEFTREYVDIARARLAYWMAQGVQLSLFDELTA